MKTTTTEALRAADEKAATSFYPGRGDFSLSMRDSFKQGIAHERERSARLVEALRYIRDSQFGKHPRYVADEALAAYRAGESK